MGWMRRRHCLRLRRGPMGVFAISCALAENGSVILDPTLVEEQVVKLLRGGANVLKWARAQVNNSTEDSIALDETATNQNSNIQFHINLALLDAEDDSLSVNSDFVTANTSLEGYLKGRCSQTSSFD
ncbi:uncharacterized protein A4U43_C05F17790 [Asparagus officinalis]|uniref:Uncharacterized protein n=1 Tax=Asparagus officinalis TaxID=4686 RepID=A0A5P1ESL9_ASPOF|nr:uncharacterized protein A4U43_C05F17790 [Asparagus officinalis]